MICDDDLPLAVNRLELGTVRGVIGELRVEAQN